MRYTYIVMGLLLLLFLSACSQKPEDVRQEIWDEAIQFTIHSKMIVDGDDPKDYAEQITERISGWASDEDLTEAEEELQLKLLDLHRKRLMYGLAVLINEDDTASTKEEFDSTYKEVEEILGANNLRESNFDESYLKTVVTAQAIQGQEQRAEDEKKFKRSASISLDAKEVQYNMPNNLGKFFYIEGSLEACDYYNYGFTNEREFFCGRLTPFDGGYSDSWYLYFERDSFDSVYQRLMIGNVDIRVAAIIDSRVYKPNQGNMARVFKSEIIQ